MTDMAALTAAVETGDRQAALRLTTEGIAEGASARALLDAMTAAMDTVGTRFQNGEIFIPEMLISARAMKEAMAVLEPLLTASGIRPRHRAVVGTVQGDLHDIGKNLVSMMWKGADIEVFDLGVNVSANQFIAAAQEHDANLIGISALLTTTMAGMGQVVAAIRAANLPVKVLVGGAPLTREYASQIGADGYAPDAAAAVEVARAVLDA
jgi:5-methyltetrahydrofolate--homocysteine methyltransferase